MYGGIASELLRQLRVESKLRAKIFEAIISRAWGLCDALLPQLQQSSGVASAASAEARTLRSELSSSAGFKRRLPCLRVAAEPRAPLEQFGGSPWPPQPASGRPKLEGSSRVRQQ